MDTIIIEKDHSDGIVWLLITPEQSYRNRHFYEKLGYKKVGEDDHSERLTLIQYQKEMITYREMKSGEEPMVAELIKNVFDAFVAPDFTPEGIETFLAYIAPTAIHSRTNNYEDDFIITARANETIVGVIEVRNFNHISLLFVNKRYQKNGIAKKLFGLALQRCKDSRAELKEFEVHSSRYAVSVYEKLGFQRIGAEQIEDGILFAPMKANV